MSEKKLLLTYSVLDAVYKNSSLRFLRGLQDATSSPANIGTISIPRDTCVPLLPTDPDPKMFSYAYKGEARVLLAKVVTPVSGSAANTTWTLLAPAAPPYGPWATLARDITLQDSLGNVIATNPYGVAQVGDWLYIVDYDAKKIYTVGVNELNGLPTGSTYALSQAPLDLSANLPADAKGQAIIALQNGSTSYLFALYITLNSSYVHSAGTLVRLTVNATTGAPSYNLKSTTGLNPQEIIPLIRDNTTNPTTYVVVPCVGGSQQGGGATNGALSMIQSLPAFIPVWPTTLTTNIVGDPSGTPGSYDIFNLAGTIRVGDSGIVYILTYDYDNNYTATDWQLYSTTIGNLLGQINTALSGANFISVDSGSGTPGYFWNILFENSDDLGSDRLWFFEGSALLVNPALAYTPAPQSDPANKFYPIGNAAGQIGGENVDWADLTIETVNQAAAGVSLKRSVQAQKAPAPKAEGEEEK
jgi:hypothetical protein